LQSEFYRLFDAKSPEGDIPTTFSIRSHKAHRALKRQVGAAFSMSSILEMEALVDKAMQSFTQKLDGLLDQDIDFGAWLHWFSFDVISVLTFSKPLGFLEEEKDIDGIISALEDRQAYNAVIGEIPVLHNVLLGSRFLSHWISKIPACARLNASQHIVQFATQQVRLRQSAAEDVTKRDLLARFKQEKDSTAEGSDRHLLAHAVTNM